MAGNEKSGRGTKGEEKASKKQAAVSRQTRQTKRALDMIAQQRGDRRFKVMKVYASSAKAFVGYITEPTEDAAGLAFGGGVYECRLMNRDEPPKETGERYTLMPHPGLFPINPKFALDPHAMERNGSMNINPAGNNAPPNNNGKRTLSEDEIYAKVERDLTKKMAEEAARLKLTTDLATLTAKLEALQANPQQKNDFQEEAAKWFAFYKQMQPTPTPNNNAAPGMAGSTDALGQLSQMAANMKQFKEIAKQLVGGESKDPFNDVLMDKVGRVLEVGLTKWENGAPMGLNTTAPTSPAAPAAPAAGATVKPSPVAGPVNAADNPTEEELKKMQEELTAYLSKAQDEYIRETPGASIYHAGDWVRAKMKSEDKAWSQLDTVLKMNDTEKLMAFFQSFAPQLVDNEKKKAWLAALIDLLKMPPQAPAGA